MQIYIEFIVARGRKDHTLGRKMSLVMECVAVLKKYRSSEDL